MFRSARTFQKLLHVACGTLLACHAVAQDVWRCGNDYTNQPDPAKACQRLSSSTVTVIEGTRVQQSGAASLVPPSAPGVTRPTPAQISVTEQRERDKRSRQILQAELDRVLSQQNGLRAQWAQGDAVEKTRLRATLERLEADAAALKREIGP